MPNATRPVEPAARVEHRPDVRPRPDRATRPVRAPRTPRPAIAERSQARVKPARSALPTRPDRARRPARTASPEAIARTRAIHQALRTQRARTYHFRGRTLHAHRVRPYRYPHGWRYRAWRRHQRFPVELFLSAWFLNDFLNYGLYAPPPGYRWVRYGPDAVLVDASSYDVADAAYGVFDDGSAEGGYEPSDLPPLDPDLPREFADGSFDLAQGQDQSDACAFFYGDRQTQDDIDAAWAAEDWNGLAKTVIWAGCGNDISYYLLGLAAEGLALPDAAANYYGRALDLADGDADDTFKCAISGPDACRGLDIGAEASNGLDRIFGPQQQ
jgi:Ni/Co efflux regulator RcnB